MIQYLLLLLISNFIGMSNCAETATYTQTATPASASLVAQQTFSNDDNGVLEGGMMSVQVYVGTIEDTEDVKIMMAPNPPAASSGYTIIGIPYKLVASDDEPYLFNIPPMVRIQLASADVNGKDATKIGLYFMPDGLNTYMLVPRSTYDPTTMKVYGYPDRDGYIVAQYGDIKSSDTTNKVKSGHAQHMPSKGAFALLCMAFIAVVAIAVALYRRHQTMGGSSSSSSSSAAGRIANPVEKEHAMDSPVSSKREMYEGSAAAAAATTTTKEKPKHSVNARKSMKVEKLPKGWVEYETDDGTGVYYFNEATGVTQWERPTK